MAPTLDIPVLLLMPSTEAVASHFHIQTNAASVWEQSHFSRAVFSRHFS